MKELSIEEKAKAYDEAIGRAKEQLEGAKVFDYKEGQIAHDIRTTTYAIFPELAESEDEKIKGAIIDHLKDNNLIEWAAWLEKQGEHESAIEMKSAEESLGISSEEYNYIVNECLYGESKSADKVEPKFNKGEWVVNKLGESWHIDSFDKKNYQVCDGKGNYNWFPISKQDEMHLWTIEDAKKGDVLFSDLMDGKTFIYNGVNSDKAILYSFIISNDGKDVLPYHIGKSNTGIGNIEENKNIIRPATKEQRDILFAKMKEAGYEWDEEKKELKRIEQVDGFDAELNALRKRYEHLPKEEVAECLSFYLGVVQGEQKPKWSKEDERGSDETLELLEYFINYTPEFRRPAIRRSIDWIKSLKERMEK